MSLTVYGIPNCDTVKRARAWLTDQGVAHRFHDFRKAGVPQDRLDDWWRAAGPSLVNRQGTTWRGLDEADRAAAQDEAGALALMVRQPALIKRPVVDWPDGQVTVGFDPERWRALLAA